MPLDSHALTLHLADMVGEGSWQAGATDEALAALSASVMAALDGVEASAADWIREDLEADDAASVLRGVGTAVALGQLRSAGHSVTGRVGACFLALDAPFGPYLLAPLAFDVARLHRGKGQRRRRLYDALDALFEGKRYILTLRKPLPEPFDPLPLVQPIKSWLMAVERGHWDGDYAIHEDSGVGLELCLVDIGQVGSGRSLLFSVPPPIVRSQLAEVNQAVLDVALANDELEEPRPLLPLIVTDVPWADHGSALLEAFYGRPRSTSYSADRREARFLPQGGGLLLDPLCAPVAGVWLLDFAGGGEARSTLHENPWADERGPACAIVGPGWVVDLPGDGVVHKAATMVWRAGKGP